MTKVKTNSKKIENCFMCKHETKNQPITICDACKAEQEDYMQIIKQRERFQSPEFITRLEAICKDFDIYRNVNPDYIMDVLENVIKELSDRGSRFQRAFDKLVEETLVYMRVNQLLVQSIAQGGTHHDKDNRCDYAIQMMARQYRHLHTAKGNIEFFEKLAWEKDYHGPSYETLALEKTHHALEIKYSLLAKDAVKFQKLLQEINYEVFTKVNLRFGKYWEINPNPREEDRY